MTGVRQEAPPSDVLGQVVPIQRLVVRSDHAVIALHHAVAFPEGCILVVRLAARRGSLERSVWSAAQDELAGRSSVPGGPRGPLWGVHLPDGSVAMATQFVFPPRSPVGDEPESPLLVEVGTESSGSDLAYDAQMQLWLSPLPPPVPFEVVVEWATLGIGQATCTLDGGDIVRAADHALSLWPR